MSVITETLAAAQAPCLTSSFQAECVVLTHMLQQRCPDIPVLFLDTVHHFAETYEYRDRQVAAHRLNLITLRAAEPQPGLWQTDSTEACCARHKVGPLFAALEQYDTWFTALRRDQSPSRANLQEAEPFRLPTGTMIRRVAPLAAWTAKDVWQYAKAHGLELIGAIGLQEETAIVPEHPGLEDEHAGQQRIGDVHVNCTPTGGWVTSRSRYCP